MATIPAYFTDFARLSPDGSIALPRDVRKALGVGQGDRVTFIVKDGEVRLVNSAVRAMSELQDALEGEAERLGLTTEEDVVELIKEIRYGDEK